ncbi:MAG: hypothetical protein U0359_02800 [Byssovorax sp.]
MNALKARVRSGRLQLDEPTELPEGLELNLELADGGDELDDVERGALDAALTEGLAEMEAGHLVDASIVIAELRARS